jgi:hypothetical protein
VKKITFLGGRIVKKQKTKFQQQKKVALALGLVNLGAKRRGAKSLKH